MNNESNIPRRPLASIVIVKDIYIYNWVNNNWVVGNFVGELYKPSGIIGNDLTRCPETIDFPGIYEDELGRKGEASIVDIRAFTLCANRQYGKTKNVRLPKEVRIIRDMGFDRAYDLESFIIEEGSKLEEIYSGGIAYAGSGRDNSMYQIDLVLPHSLKVISENGIYDCPRIKSISYCGFFVLNEDLRVGNTKVLVTKRYQFREIFKKSVESINEELYDEAEINCAGQTPPNEGCEVVHTVAMKSVVFLSIFIVDQIPPLSTIINIKSGNLKEPNGQMWVITSKISYI